ETISENVSQVSKGERQDESREGGNNPKNPSMIVEMIANKLDRVIWGVEIDGTVIEDAKDDMLSICLFLNFIINSFLLDSQNELTNPQQKQLMFTLLQRRKELKKKNSIKEQH
ncbi:660_t:CDS:1, partial [Funneliformis mosseae]